MNRDKNSLRRAGGLELIAIALMVMISMTGIAAANPFDIKYHLAAPNQNTDAGNPIIINQGSSTVLSLNLYNFPTSGTTMLPDDFPLQYTVTCAAVNPVCHTSDITVTIAAPQTVHLTADPSILADKLIVTWSGANDPDGTTYVLGLSSTGTKGEFGTTSRSIVGHIPNCGESGQPQCNQGDEWWNVEWFNTQPAQFTKFHIDGLEDQNVLVTTAFDSPESTGKLWTQGSTSPVPLSGTRLKYWYNPDNKGNHLTDDLYINDIALGERGTVPTLRLYGTDGEGAGDHNVVDPDTNLKPENPPYTDPISPFFPQAPQSPVKDFVTFNPAYIDTTYKGLALQYKLPGGGQDQYPKEKIFQRMWYQNQWFKDDNRNGVWDKAGNAEHNNNPSLGDVYAPSIIKEYAFMALDYQSNPMMVDHGSKIMIPFASINGQLGINSNELKPGDSRLVEIESEDTLNMDIDGDGDKDKMDKDGQDVSGDESVVLRISSISLGINQEIQFFDNTLEIQTISTDPAGVTLKVCDNEGTVGGRIPVCAKDQTLSVGNVVQFQRGRYDEHGPFYVKLLSINRNENRETATIEIGRLFGRTTANIGKNPLWNQKAFMVQGVFYDVVGIKARDNTFKYIIVREKLPKFPIGLFGTNLAVWNEHPTGTPDNEQNYILPELPPFNEAHTVLLDILSDQTIPGSLIGTPSNVPDRLKTSYVEETTEPRFRGELLEIFKLLGSNEKWMEEWFHTLPENYTEFVMAGLQGQKILVTTGFYAPEAHTDIWDGQSTTPVAQKDGDRLKFWFDPNPSVEGQNNAEGIFIDNGELKLHGTYGEGPGDTNVKDPDYPNLRPEQYPYTDPTAPFYPQAEQAPVKDHVTFNPAIFDKNSENPNVPLEYILSNGGTEQWPKEKIFKRMWYEKEWFKDDNKDGVWNKIRNIQYNNDPTKADVYSPAFDSEYTFMTLDYQYQPMLVRYGSKLLIPMASYDGKGIDSFDADGDGTDDPVQIESEYTVGIDIDNQSGNEHMGDATPVSGDESVVLRLTKTVNLQQDDEFPDRLQFFDNKVRLTGIRTNAPGVTIEVSSNEGANRFVSKDLAVGEVKKFSQGQASDTFGPFYVKLLSVNTNEGRETATIEVGRLFGKVGANIGKNERWNQKAFIVQGVFYNVVGIYAQDDMFKYMVIRQKLPKFIIGIYGTNIMPWGINTQLPELPPFNVEHDVVEDVTHSNPLAPSYIGKILSDQPALNIRWTDERDELRFKGELKEIYNQTRVSTPGGGGGSGTCKGDLYPVNNPDGVINVGDFSIFGAAFGTSNGDAGYRAGADLYPNAPDGVINVGDFSIFGSRFGTICS